MARPNISNVEPAIRQKKSSPPEIGGPKQTKMQSALSLHLNNLVQRTQKNLNTGVFTQLNPGTSSLHQTGIGFSSSVKNKRIDNIFENMDRNGDTSGLGLYIGGNNSLDLQNTSSQNLRRGFTTTPNSNLIYPNQLNRPSTSSGAQGTTIQTAHFPKQSHQLQYTLQSAIQNAQNTGTDSGGATAANYDQNKNAKRSHSSGFQQQVNRGVNNYFQAFRSMEGQN